MEISYTKVFAGHPVLSFSPWTTVSSDPLTNVTVTLPFLWLAGWLCHRQQDWLTTKSFRHSTEWAEQDAAVSWTKTSPGDVPGESPAGKQTLPGQRGLTKKHPSAQEQRDSPVPKKVQQQWLCTHPPRAPRFLEDDWLRTVQQAYTELFTGVPAMCSTGVCTDTLQFCSLLLTSNETGINLSLRRSRGSSSLWRTTWVSPNIPYRNHI